MRITSDSTLREVAFIVCTELQRVGVTAVLTGGSAAAIWSVGTYQSHDCDCIISFHEKGAPAEATLLKLGYTESGGTYCHSDSPFTLEFPPGPLSVGDEILTEWNTLRDGDLLLHILTPTDSCRDRLAAFYHWKDYSSLSVAVAIAGRNQIDLKRVRQWSKKEGVRSNTRSSLARSRLEVNLTTRSNKGMGRLRSTGARCATFVPPATTFVASL